MSKSSVDEIRRQIDSLDNKLHDLLMKRADMVIKIGDFKRKNDIEVVQPDREMRMIRRLMDRHHGPLPKEAVVRIWRELVGAVSLLQTGLKVAVSVPDNASSLKYWDMAKDYFSSVLPMQTVSNALGTMGMVREGDATFGVMPWPDDEVTHPWWPYLLSEQGEKPVRIVARLPLGNRNAMTETAHADSRALVVARLPFVSSGDDRSFLLLELDNDISRARIVSTIEALGFKALGLHTAPSQDNVHAYHLIELDDFLESDDDRLSSLLEKVGDLEGQYLVVGGYPVPPVYEDSVGKGAETVLTSPSDSAKKAS